MNAYNKLIIYRLIGSKIKMISTYFDTNGIEQYGYLLID